MKSAANAEINLIKFKIYILSCVLIFNRVEMNKLPALFGCCNDVAGRTPGLWIKYPRKRNSMNFWKTVVRNWNLYAMGSYTSTSQVGTSSRILTPVEKRLCLSNAADHPVQSPTLHHAEIRKLSLRIICPKRGCRVCGNRNATFSGQPFAASN